MNAYQNKLFTNLMTLCDTNEAFYYTDQQVGDSWYRIFLHRLASYTDFLEPGALEGRGAMFEMNAEGKDAFPVYFASLPFEKFFNYRENPFTMDVDFSDVVAVEEKRDGSLMSTYLHSFQGKDVLKLKSKGSTQSPQCQDAMGWLYLAENDELYYDLKEMAHMGYTVIMEWTSPDNRIVLGYEKPALTVLAIRYNQDGSYVTRDGLEDNWVAIKNAWVREYLEEVEQDYKSVEEFVEFVVDPSNTSVLLEGIEGFVLILGSGQRMKIKAAWYLTRHRMKDGINSPRRLFEAVLDEATDDMRTLFFDDPLAMKQIADMEKFAERHYNHMVDTVERFFERNKHMDRKEYAILGQKEMTRFHFGLAMQKYTGKKVDYKMSLKKKWRDLGLKDEVQLEEGEE